MYQQVRWGLSLSLFKIYSCPRIMDTLWRLAKVMMQCANCLIGRAV